MSKVVMHNVVSVDGFIADDRDDIGPLFDWYFNGDVPLSPDGALKMSQPSFDYVRPAWDDIGCNGDRPTPVRRHGRLAGTAAGGRSRRGGLASAQAGPLASRGLV